MSNDEKIKDGSSDDELGVNPNLSKQLEDTARVFKTLKELSSSPIQQAIESKVGELTLDVIQQAFSRPTKFSDALQDQIANNPHIHKMIIENMFCQPSKQERSNSKDDIYNKDEEIPIHEKLSPEDVYIIRIIEDELEVVENYNGEVAYKRIKLTS